MTLIPLRRLGVAVGLGEQPPSLALEVGDFLVPEHQRVTLALSVALSP